MIRIIVRTHEYDCNSGFESKDHHTIDVEIPELETLLKDGGRGESGFRHSFVLGVELIEAQP